MSVVKLGAAVGVLISIGYLVHVFNEASARREASCVDLIQPALDRLDVRNGISAGGKSCVQRLRETDSNALGAELSRRPSP